jgi:hypothetical protein
VASKIGTLAESSLHIQLKGLYSREGDEVEVDVDGYVADIRHGHQLIEIQTSNFSGFKRKLAHLLRHYPVHVVYPVAEIKRVLRIAHGGMEWRNGHARKGRVIDIFDELVSIPDLVMDPNLTFEVALVEEEEVVKFERRYGRGRGGWSVVDRRLIGLRGRVLIASLADFQALLPDGLAEPFTTSQLAKALPSAKDLAGKMAYVLKRIGAIERVGKRRNSLLFARPRNPELSQMDTEFDENE